MTQPQFPHDRLTLINNRYTVSAITGVITSTFDDGIDDQRPRNRRIPHVRTLQYLACSRADFEYWQNWHRDVLRNGSLSFLWRDPVRSEYRRASIPGGDYKATATSKLLTRWLIEFTLRTTE